MNDQDRRNEWVLGIAFDDLRRRLIQEDPQIKSEVELMANMIRELVNLERAKLGLDNPRGTIELWPNKEKKHASEPDFWGAGKIAGRSYRAAGWLAKSDKIKISLLPPKRK